MFILLIVYIPRSLTWQICKSAVSTPTEPKTCSWKVKKRGILTYTPEKHSPTPKDRHQALLRDEKHSGMQEECSHQRRPLWSLCVVIASHPLKFYKTQTKENLLPVLAWLCSLRALVYHHLSQENVGVTYMLLSFFHVTSGSYLCGACPQPVFFQQQDRIHGPLFGLRNNASVVF